MRKKDKKSVKIARCQGPALQAIFDQKSSLGAGNFDHNNHVSLEMRRLGNNNDDANPINTTLVNRIKRESTLSCIIVHILIMQMFATNQNQKDANYSQIIPIKSRNQAMSKVLTQ